MGHTIKEKTKLLNRVRRLRGQVEAIERALDAEDGCSEILHLIAGVRGAINGLMIEVVEDHVRTHVLEDVDRRSAQSRAGEELIEIVRSYLK